MSASEHPASTSIVTPSSATLSVRRSGAPKAWGLADPLTSLSLGPSTTDRLSPSTAPVVRGRVGCRPIAPVRLRPRDDGSRRMPRVTPGPVRRPRQRVRRAAAPGGARGAAGRARPGVRRPAPAAPRRPRGAAAARQRPRGRGRRARRAARRGHLHRRAAPHAVHLRAARAAARLAPRDRRSCTRPSSTRPCATPCAGAPRAATVGVPSTGSGRVDRGRPVAGALLAPSVGVVALQTANHEVGTLQPVGELDAARRRPALHRRVRLDGPAAPPDRAGPPPPARRTSGAARPASACCWCASARGGATRSPATTGSTSGRPASRTSPPCSPPPPRCRRWWPSATRSTRASTRSIDVVRRRVAAEVPDVEVVGDPDRPPPPPGDVLLPLRRRRGAGHRARPARLRHRQRLGLHRLDADAQPRAGGDGRADPRQRPALAAARHDPRRRRRLLRRCCPAWSPRSGRGWACDATLDVALELDCRELRVPDAGHRARPAPRRRRGRRAARGGRPRPRRARSTYRPGAG